MEPNEIDKLIDTGSIMIKALIRNFTDEVKSAESAVFGDKSSGSSAGDAAGKTENAPSEEKQPAVSKEFTHELQQLLLKNHALLSASPEGAKMLSDVMELLEKYGS